MDNRAARSSRTAPTGQAMVELALVCPFLVVVMMVAVDFSRGLAFTIAASNAAKQASTFASQSYISPVACLQEQAQQLVGDEVGGTVTLTELPMTAPSYPGETNVQATVTYSFTTVTPLVATNRLHPLVIHQSAADHIIPKAIVGTWTPPAPSDVQLNANIPDHTTAATQTTYLDRLSWSLTNQSGMTATYDLDNGSGPEAYTGYFLIYRSFANTTGPAPNGCPVARVAMSAAWTPHDYVYTYDVDHPDRASSYTYWAQAVGPHPPAFAGQTSAATMAHQ